MLAAKVRVEQGRCLRTQLVQRGGEARLALQPVEPHLRVHAVVGLLAVDLGGQTGDLGIVGSLQPLEPDRIRPFVQVVACDRLSPVEQPQLDDRRAAVLVRRAVEGQLVRGRPALACHELVERSRVPDLVLCDRRERDVLFQQRRDPGPLRVAPAEDQLVVSDLQEQLLFLLCHGPPSISP